MPRVIRRGCPRCRGDLYRDEELWRDGERWRLVYVCLLCSRVYQPEAVGVTV